MSFLLRSFRSAAFRSAQARSTPRLKGTAEGGREDEDKERSGTGSRLDSGSAGAKKAAE